MPSKEIEELADDVMRWWQNRETARAGDGKEIPVSQVSEVAKAIYEKNATFTQRLTDRKTTKMAATKLVENYRAQQNHEARERESRERQEYLRLDLRTDEIRQRSQNTLDQYDAKTYTSTMKWQQAREQQKGIIRATKSEIEERIRKSDASLGGLRKNPQIKSLADAAAADYRSSQSQMEAEMSDEIKKLELRVEAVERFCEIGRDQQRPRLENDTTFTAAENALMQHLKTHEDSISQIVTHLQVRNQMYEDNKERWRGAYIARIGDIKTQHTESVAISASRHPAPGAGSPGSAGAGAASVSNNVPNMRRPRAQGL